MEIKEKLNLNDEDYVFSFETEFNKYLFTLSQINSLCNEAQRILKRISDNLNCQRTDTGEDNTGDIDTRGD